MSDATATIVVPASHPALPGHFSGNPIVPAAWLLTLVAKACEQSLGVADLQGLRHVRFRAPLRPGVECTIAFDQRADGVAFRLDSAEGRIADGMIATPIARAGS